MDSVLRSLQDYEDRNAADVARYATAQPSSLLENVHLHDYQLEGMRWLLSKYAQGLNPILGDEMGLGKTLQVIAFLAALTEEQQKNTASTQALQFIVIAPLSVVPNWVEQFGAFAPSVDVLMYAGTKDERKTAQDAVKSIKESDAIVVVTSYETLLADMGIFCGVKWTLMVLDEGHRLKNPKGLLYTSLQSKLVVPRKVILSGTPIQNDLRELFALLALLNPSIFNDERAFEDRFKPYFSAKAQDLRDNSQQRSRSFVAAQEKMRQLLSPLLLIRSVKDVASSFSLPPISEIVVHTPMSPMQREYYKEIVARNSDALNSVAGARGSKVSLINILPQLRKACNHPYLFPSSEPEPFCEGSHLYENSGKLYVLHHILPKLRDRGHCVLLFSQSPLFLDIIQDYLTFEGFSYERIDGSVRGKERWQAIERFRSNPDTFVFLISTRSGGVGLNLQRADTVIFADSDYNPQADLQAVARAYRLGQTKPIHVIKFASAHTVEEIIYRRALKKMKMADSIRDCARDASAVADEADDDGDESKESLVELIQFGLHRLLDVKDSDALTEPLDDDYVEHILKRKTGEDDKASERDKEDLDDVAGDVQDENMYYFEGEDYSVSEAKTKDAELLRQICRTGPTSRKKGAATRKRYAGEEEDEINESADDVEIDEVQLAINAAEKERKRQERQRAAQEKKLAKWKRNKYSSMVIEQISNCGDGTDDDDGTSSTRSSQRLRFLAGDASRPQCPPRDASPSIVVHCVDTSGVWSTRGFFRSLAALSPRIQQQYEAAGRNDDLKLGQAHLISVQAASDDDDDITRILTNGARSTSRAVYVCLLVVQGFVSSSKASKRQRTGATTLVRTGKSTQFRLHALQTSLDALAHKACALGASVHMPRIGYGTPNFNWYAVERIMKRHLSENGVATNIYYFSPNRRPQAQPATP